MLIAVASLRGSPGATTVALAAADLAAANGYTIVVDADGDGSLLAHGYGPGLDGWSRTDGTDDPALHGTARASGAVVLAGPVLPVEMPPVVTAATAPLQRVSRAGVTVVVDCGRIGGPSAGLFRSADRRLLLVRDLPPHVESVTALLDGHHGLAEVLRVGPKGRLPDDPQTAELVTSDDCPPQMLRSSPLGRAIASVLADTGVEVPESDQLAWAAAQGAIA